MGLFLKQRFPAVLFLSAVLSVPVATHGMAILSSTTVRNPTFTPDVSGLFTFRLIATEAAAGASITTVDLTVTATPPRRRAVRSP